MKAHKPELLAPAGDRECLEAVLRYGADAVYLASTEFGMRTAPKNFTVQELQEAVAAAHRRGVPVYLTANILPRNDEMERFPAFLREITECGVDAVIAADLGMISLIRKYAKDLVIHASTQTGIVNYQTANALWEMGVRRVVLARELSLEEIAEIRAKTPPELELEMFVHGAMCMSVSGRCLLSEYFTGRDANRGACAQPCRWKYALMEETRPGSYFPIGEGEEGSYILNAKDLCLLPHLEELLRAGVDSLKIEGRAKSAYYAAGITNAYRTALDCLCAETPQEVPQWVQDEVYAVSHRPYTSGFLFGNPEDSIYPAESSYQRDTEVIGIVQRQEKGRVYVSQRNRFFEGDEAEFLCPHEEPIPIRICGLQNGEGEPIPAANHPVMDCSFLCDFPVSEGVFLRRPVKG